VKSCDHVASFVVVHPYHPVHAVLSQPHLVTMSHAASHRYTDLHTAHCNQDTALHSVHLVTLIVLSQRHLVRLAVVEASMRRLELQRSATQVQNHVQLACIQPSASYTA